MEVTRSRSLVGFLFICLAVFVGHPCRAQTGGGDADALQAFRAKADLGHVLASNWTNASHVCNWEGVKECIDGRVSKLSLEHLHLNGTFAEGTLSNLTQLRLLSLKGNDLTGTVPDLSGLINLKLLFLDHNSFTGPFPDSITNLSRLLVVVISNNQLSGPIPESLTKVDKLSMFQAENNLLNGSIPALNQSGLKSFNVSNNELSGEIPNTVALASFNSSSFLGNPKLCGASLQGAVCSTSSQGPAHPASQAPAYPAQPPVIVRSGGNKLSKQKIIGIVVGSLLGLAALLVLFIVIKKERAGADAKSDGKSVKIAADRGPPEQKTEAPVLIFCGGGGVQMYTLEDLLRASAEILGRGSVGITYRAVMDWGLMVTVKRLKNSLKISNEEFESHLNAIGKFRHPNLISLRAYFHAQEERLLIYDYQPNGSLFSFIHGSGDSSGGKPLHWTSCVKIAKEVANGLAYLHQAFAHNFHGNLHPSNVLLGREMEVCLTEFGLTVFQSDNATEGKGKGEGEGEGEGSFVAYRAPECKLMKNMVGPRADVYSYGILVLEILTGRTPAPSFLHGQSSSTDQLLSWVRSVREQEMEEAAAADDSASDELAVLLNVAVACVAVSPDERPTMAAVLGMLENAKEESQIQIHGEEEGDNSSERSW